MALVPWVMVCDDPESLYIDIASPGTKMPEFTVIPPVVIETTLPISELANA